MLEYNLSELARQVRIKGLFSARPSDYENSLFVFIYRVIEFKQANKIRMLKIQVVL